MGVNKINSELQMILSYNTDDTYRRRVEWANARGKRIQFIKELTQELKTDGLTDKKRAKAYSTAVVEYDKQNMKMSWAT